MDKLNKTSQKRVTTVNDFLLKTFKTTSDLNSSLKRQRVLPKNDYLETGRKTLELLNTLPNQKRTSQADKEKEQQYLIGAEVKNLEHYQRAEPNPKIATMIRDQKDKRRDRHFSLLDEYEKLVEVLYKEVEHEYDYIKRDVTEFYRDNDIEMREYFAQFTDEALLALDKRILDELRDYIVKQQDLRGEKIINLLGKLTDVEHEREKSMVSLLDGLKDSLIDNAYFLQGQVEELIKEEEAKYEEVIVRQKEANEAHVDEINDLQRKTFEEFVMLAQEVDRKWRILQHNAAMEAFREEMVKEEYTNPPERNALYDELKGEQLEIYAKRRETFKQMATMNPDRIKKSPLEKMLEGIKELNDNAQAKYDKKFEELLNHHNQLEAKLNDVKERLRDRLTDFGAELEEGNSVEAIMEGEIQQRIGEILTNNKATLSHAIACIEENDLKANELLTNLLNFYIKLGVIQDTNDVNLKKNKFDYELEKAKVADENDEKLEQLNEELEVKKKNIREAVHHPKLEDFLQEGFAKLDDVEGEYRTFHDKNLELVQRHPHLINDFFSIYEKEVAGKFELVDESKQAEIQAKYQKEAEDKVRRMYDEEEKLKEEEEQRAQAAQAASGKKGGKPPAKKDPKKQQKDMEDRLAQLLKEVGVRQVQVYESPFGTKWLYFATLQEFTKEFFTVKEDEGAKKADDKNANAAAAGNELQVPKPEEKKETVPTSKQGARDKKPDPKGKKDEKPQEPAIDYEALKKKEEEEKAKYFTEWRVVAPKDLHENLLLSEDVFFTFEEVCSLVNILMTSFFDESDRRKERTLDDAETSDKDFIETSMILLDQRLKAHYPLKGRLETEIYQLRSSEIAEHKKRYERHVRTIVEKLDNQTEEFNLMLEEAVESVKTFEKEQKDLRDALTTAESISRMDGIQTQAKDKSTKFGENNAEIENHLRMLSLDETNKLLQFNRDFIKNLQLFQNGGNFSNEEVNWYDDMLKDIDEKIKAEAEGREKRLKEITELLARKKQQLTTQFESEYVVALEELCAKDGTGKKYGKPKRVAQERLRTEMNKCERAQEAIGKLVDDIEKQYQAFSEAVQKGQEDIFIGNPSFSLQVRSNLMAFRSCVTRYSTHIGAIKADCPVEAMPRITYIEERLGIAVTPQETEQDNKRKEEELELLGPLYYQKENKKFTEWIQDIENNIKSEAQKLYTDKNAKFLTGTDKIPDYLRTYLEGVRRQMDEFRNSCCRNLRNSCMKLSDFSEKINEMIFESLKRRYLVFSLRENTETNGTFDAIMQETEDQKEKNTWLLRPNLANPACKEEFEDLNKKEQERFTKYLEDIEVYRGQLNEKTQTTSNRFFKAMTNNFEFLILYYDRVYLFEDFARLPGDEEIQKKRATLKELLKTKLTGVTIDRSTERCIEKKWPGIVMDTFMIAKGTPLPYEEDELALPTGGEAQQKAGGAAAKGKAGKKDDKKGGKENVKKPADAGKGEVKEEGAVPKTREVPSFKTFRQKTCYQNRNKVYEEYKKYFEGTIHDIARKFDSLKEKELKYQFQWERSIDQIFHKD